MKRFAGTGTRLFLCPPTYYDVIYSINPWMDPSVPVDKLLAWRQWSRLVSELEELGADIEFIAPRAGCPDMVFLGDAGVALGDRFLCSRFRHAERADEAAHYADAFARGGYRVELLPPDAILEGLGDISLHGRRAVLGHGPRSNAAGFAAFRRFAPWVEVIAEVALPDPRFYHLATALVFLDHDTVLYAPQALTAEGIRALEKALPRTVAVSDEDLFCHQACNCVVLDNIVFLDGATPKLRSTLEGLGFSVRICPASEFVALIACSSCPQPCPGAHCARVFTCRQTGTRLQPAVVWSKESCTTTTAACFSA